MKSIKYILLFILLIPFNVYAYELSCPSGPFEYEDTFECYIKGNDSITYDELSGSFDFSNSSVLTCDIEEPSNGLSKKDASKGFSYTGKSDSEELVKLSCKVTTKPSSSGYEQIIVPDFKYHELDSNKDAFTEILRSKNILYKGYVEQKQVDTKPRSTENPNTRLKNVSDPNLDFIFSAFKTEYDISVKYEIDSVDLLVVPNNEEATVEIKGSQKLEIGENIIDIYVTSPDGESKTCYTLTINRLKRGEDIYYIEKDSSLSALTIDGYRINFESIIYDYKIHIKYDVDSVNVKATATNPGASINVSNTDDLKNGSTITVTVTSQDGSSTSTYNIKVTKDSAPKDYKSTIYITVFVVAIAIVIIIILRTNVKNKSNPLLKKKSNKKENNKLDMNSVPNADNNNVITPAPEQPAESVEVLPAQPEVQPQPAQPVVAPVVPQEPVVPTVPEAPVAPAEPVATPEVPVQPVEVPQPVAPVAPVQPVAIVEQNVVSPVPVEPQVVQTAPVVETPQVPVTPDVPQVPVQPEVQTQPVQQIETNIFDQ